MVIVTGGSGHIGNVLIRTLLHQGYKVAVIDIDPKPDISIAELPIKYIQGDIRDKNFLLKVFKGAEYVYHLAGIISIKDDNKDLLYDVNVEGTRNVVEACKETCVKRLLYTSSIHALYEPRKGTPIIEKLAKPDEVIGEYAKTKILATEIVMNAVKEGLNAVIVYPSGVVGPYDFKNSEMGTLINQMINSSKLFYVEGGYNFVDVRDLAKGIILAMEKGKRGEGYLLAGEGITIQELFDLLAKLTNSTKTKIKVPTSFLKLILPLADFFYKILKQKPLLTQYSLEVLNSNYMVDSTKAKKELGYKTRNMEETIKDTINWHKNNKNDRN